MKTLYLLVLLFVVALDMRSSALAAGQGGMFAKLKQLPAVKSMSGKLKGGVDLIRRAALRSSVAPDGQSKVVVL